MSQQTATDTLVVYSDYVCPFCYLGRASLERYREQRDDPLDVEWRVFDLRGGKRDDDGEIDHDADDGKDEEYYEQARQNVERLQERYDVEMSIDLSRDVDSWNANKAAVHLRQTHDADDARAFHHAVFDALWQDARDIGDPDVLADLAEDVGLDPDEIRDAVDDDGLDAELRERFDAARRAGVRGVPTFAADEHAASGAIPPEQLRRLVEGSDA
ncbi:DsbA family oxidoreductase [Halomicrococcus sp. SG-WS-1]|uniref:DsbA family oxidoreductase n=1 Tax=Halomicrococcus sp. SG-WS-1 TaxID=3439057 RepID=UPI003F79AC55